jgi:hypothetical protein
VKYEARCGCGKAHAVTAADAGASLRCACGGTVEVPPLHQLRAAAGQQVLSPVVRVQTLLLEGRLPGTRSCAVCHRDTSGLVHARVQCQWAVVSAGGPSRAEVAGGCLLSFGLGLFLHMLRRNAPSKEHGQDVVVVVPLPVCETCRPGLDGPAALRQALHHVPEYAELLDQYPNARVTRAG